jgi:hypothetical protein
MNKKEKFEKKKAEVLIKAEIKELPGFKKGREKLLSLKPNKPLKSKDGIYAIGTTIDEPVATDHVEPAGAVLKCLWCDVIIHDSHNRKIEQCPHCGFDLVAVDTIGMILIKQGALITTEPN